MGELVELNEPLELEEALGILTEHAPEIMETETLPLPDACGRVLSEDVTAERNQPPFPRSPLDGYAVKSADLIGAGPDSPAVLRVLDEVDAGHPARTAVRGRTAVRIMTGAPIPDGADTVVRQEDTDEGEETVQVFCTQKPWENYCPAGEDYHKGDPLLKKGMRLYAAEIGILAGLGRTEVKVFRKPRVLLLSTGDELAEPGSSLSEGQIYNSNLPMLRAQCRLWDLEVAGAGSVPDDAEAAASFLRENADRADLILTTGGVSVGKRDILHEVYRILGAERLFWRIAVKPGMPVLAGMYDGREILSLSGNPYAALADLALLVKPVLRKMTGRDDLRTVREKAVLLNGYPKKSPGRRFVRGFVRDGKVRLTDKSNDSGILSSMAGLNCMAEIPAGSPELHAGEIVTLVRL